MKIYTFSITHYIAKRGWTIDKRRRLIPPRIVKKGRKWVMNMNWAAWNEAPINVSRGFKRIIWTNQSQNTEWWTSLNQGGRAYYRIPKEIMSIMVWPSCTDELYNRGWRKNLGCPNPVIANVGYKMILSELPKAWHERPCCPWIRQGRKNWKRFVWNQKTDVYGEMDRLTIIPNLSTGTEKRGNGGGQEAVV